MLVVGKLPMKPTLGLLGSLRKLQIPSTLAARIANPQMASYCRDYTFSFTLLVKNMHERAVVSQIVVAGSSLRQRLPRSNTLRTELWLPTPYLPIEYSVQYRGKAFSRTFN
jgi:hypothetical protein